MWSAMLSDYVARFPSPYDSCGLWSIHALCLASVHCYPYDMLLSLFYLMHSILLRTFIYLPDFHNFTMLHLVLGYRCPNWARGWDGPEGSAVWWTLWVEHRQCSLRLSWPAPESHWLTPRLYTFWFSHTFILGHGGIMAFSLTLRHSVTIF